MTSNKHKTNYFYLSPPQKFLFSSPDAISDSEGKREAPGKNSLV